MKTILFVFNTQNDLIKFRESMKSYLSTINCIEYNNSYVIYTKMGNKLIFHINNDMLLRYTKVQAITHCIEINTILHDVIKNELYRAYGIKITYTNINVDLNQYCELERMIDLYVLA